MGRRKPLVRGFYNLDLIAEDGVRRKLREQAEKISSRIETGITVATTIVGAYIGATSLDPFVGAMIGTTAGATVGMIATLPVNHYFPDWYEAKLNRNWEEAGKPLSSPYDKSIIEKDRDYRRKQEEELKKNKDNDNSLSYEKSSNEKENKSIPKFSGIFKSKSPSLKLKSEQKIHQNDMGRGND